MKKIFTILPLLFLLCACSAEQPKPPADAAQIAFDHEEFDFGHVAEGIELEHKFKIFNRGTQPLQIFKAYSTCGCTVPTLPKTLLQPGESTTLTVQLDTSMKQDQVTKTVDVSSDDPDKPLVILSLSMDVENRHKALAEHSKAKFLTDAKCINCHVLQGVGLFGEELYKSDCAMCHGDDAQGGVGPCLVRDYSDPELKKHIWQVTAYGSKRKITMPGFLADAGGPLAKEQVDSIVEYLSHLEQKK
ncbi:MAG TPA: DUF1573 domain-containing protein [Candidatus Melainabacteria bacterium]|nr:DUF1573 domain-containing protein [Candidatus Melainabacteria bacterium]